MNKKLRKLIYTPKLFFKDMMLNSGRAIGVFPPEPTSIGNYQYSVVSAVYNVGRYLDDYFNSLIKQQLNFQRHIHLIMVDDGSTDNSAIIIKRWQKKYPDNITYLWKENGGQASARNLGLQHVKTEWVTFIDPDDFVDIAYFKKIDHFLHKSKNNNIQLVSCNFIFYFEESKKQSDTHPLNYRFKKGDTSIVVSELKEHIQLSVNSAIFKYEIIKSNKIYFNEAIKPNFEDAAFSNEYMLYINTGKISFLKGAKYFYRKRDDKTSTLDTSWEKAGLYNEVLELGCLRLLQMHHKMYGNVPSYMQRTVLYHLIWYFKKLINNECNVSFLNEYQKNNFKNLLNDIFSYIDVKAIMEFNLGGSWFFHKVGMLNLFKHSSPDFQIVYIEAWDDKKQQIQLRYFNNEKILDFTTINGVNILPDYVKKIDHSFIDDSFTVEKRLWIHVAQHGKLEVKLANKPTRLSLAGKQYNNGINTIDIANHFYIKKPNYPLSLKYKNSWVFIDRDIQSDDNAEHLYRYVNKNYPEIKIWFILRKDSHDWVRLKNDGFNLIEFGSKDHTQALESCSKLISSNIDYYISNYLGANMMLDRHFVFIQHGVIINDLSGWLNTKEQINCFITTTIPEYNSICDSSSKYKFSNKEVILTGLPRHDRLINNTEQTKKIILIMPTWRIDIVGKTIGLGFKRKINDSFKSTPFAQHWNSLLSSPILKEISQKYKYDIIFCPHANIQPYLDQFDISDHIKVVTHADMGIQDIFMQSALMITDYSSVSFEMAVQKKPTIYYQFDESEFFSGSHSCKKGYFDYRRHGFGPVVTNETSLLNELEIILINNGKASSDILERMKQTFPFQDGNNCARVYQAILALDASRDPDFMNTAIVQEYAQQASQNYAWPLAEQRWRLLMEHGGLQEQSIALLKLIEALCEQGKLAEAQQTLQRADISIANTEERQERARLMMAYHQWHSAMELWRSALPEKTVDQFRYLRCLAEQQDIVSCIAQQQKKWVQALPAHYYALFQAWLAVAQQDWQTAYSILAPVLSEFSTEALFLFKPQLLLSRCLREQTRLNQAHEQLVNYEKHTANDPQCREEIARLAFSQKRWDNLVNQLQKAYRQLSDLPQPLSLLYIQGLRKLKKSKEAEQSVTQLLVCWPENLTLRQYAAELILDNRCWKEAIQLLPMQFRSSHDPLRLSLFTKIRSLQASGHLVQAEQLFYYCVGNKTNNKTNWTSAVWREQAILHMARNNWLNAYDAWSAIINNNNKNRVIDIDALLYIEVLAEAGKESKLKQFLNSVYIKTLPFHVQQLALAWLYVINSEWEIVSLLLEACIHQFTIEESKDFKPHLLISRSFYQQHLLDKAFQAASDYKKIIGNENSDQAYLVQILLLEYEQINYKEFLKKINSLYPDINNIPYLLAMPYIKSLQQDFKLMEAERAFEALAKLYPINGLSLDKKEDILIRKRLELIQSSAISTAVEPDNKHSALYAHKLNGKSDATIANSKKH